MTSEEEAEIRRIYKSTLAKYNSQKSISKKYEVIYAAIYEAYIQGKEAETNF